jgi:hypothetical protein
VARGADVAEGFAELLPLTDLSVLLPEKRTVDAPLAAELLDLVSAHSTWLAGKIPGFADALAWPPPTRTASSA